MSLALNNWALDSTYYAVDNWLYMEICRKMCLLPCNYLRKWTKLLLYIEICPGVSLLITIFTLSIGTNLSKLCRLRSEIKECSLGGSIGFAVRLETRRSRVQPPPRSATFFRGDWSWNIFYGHSLPSADSRRAVVSFWRKNVHNTG